MQTTHLASLLQALKSLDKHFPANSYSVPGIWTGKNIGIEQVNPSEYFTSIIESILHSSDHPVAEEPGADWREGAVVYNLFIRLTTAFDQYVRFFYGIHEYCCSLIMSVVRFQC